MNGIIAIGRRATRSRAALAVFMLMLVSSAGCSAGQDAGEAASDDVDQVTYRLGEPIQDSTYAAIVSSEYGQDTLTTATFRHSYDVFVQQVPQAASDAGQQQELRKNIIEDFVLRHVVFGEAERLGIEADTERVAWQMQQFEQQYGGKEGLHQALAEQNLTEDSLRTSLREMTMQQQTIDKLAEDTPEPTDDEVESYRQEQAQQIRAQHILFMTQNKTPEEKAEIKKEAEAVLDSVKAGVDFAALASRHSDDAASARRGGDLDFFGKGQMVPPFEKAAFALKDSGDVTNDLVETRFGYHIIRLTGRRTGPLPDSSAARQMIMRQRRQDVIENALNDLKAKVTLRINDEVVQADVNA